MPAPAGLPPPLPPLRKRISSRNIKRSFGVAVLVTVCGLAAYFWVTRPAAPPAVVNWSGVWVAEGGQLPVLHLEQGGPRIVGRLILAGEDSDIGLPLADVRLLDRDQLGFATQAGTRRSVYRLLLDGSNDALLAIIDDPNAMRDYLGEAGGVAATRHSAEARDRWLKQLREPTPPRLVAVLHRVNPNALILPPKREEKPFITSKGEDHGSP